MAFGILDDYKLDSVPGTGLLSAKAKQLTADEAMGLKRVTGKHSHIVLIPQPSDDPRDLLNWPRWKKEACFWTLVFTTSIADALWALVSPAYVQLSQQFHVSVGEVASSFSASLPGLAAFTLVQNVLAVKYGHRIVYLFSTLVMFISCIWGALSPDLASLCASRILQGIGEAAPKCTVAVTIEHLYFGSLINSYVVHNLSWQLGFWFSSIACGLSFLGVLFLVPETTYRRDHNSIKQTKSENPTGRDNVDETTPQTSAISDAEIGKLDWHQHGSHSNPPTCLSQLKIYNGTFSDESIWRIFLQPFPFILSPVTWFIFLCYAFPMVLLNVIALCSSAIFTLEYDFNTAQIGLTNLAGIVGIVLALLVTGPLHDWGIVRMAQRNRGVYEPEFRLVFMLNMLVGVFGFVGWAVGNDHHMPWIGPVACITYVPLTVAWTHLINIILISTHWDGGGGGRMLYFSAVVVSATSFAYLVNAHGPTGAMHIVTLANCVMVVLEYGSAFCANRIVLAHGVHVSLLVLGACQAACLLVSVAMYVFGKRVRSFLARHPRLFQGSLLTSEEPQSAAGLETELKQ
ncbi:hypothetical protein V8D89_011048 [Ganoderma adspersum]